MTPYNPLRQLPERAGYGKGDVLVLVGELFGRGYANGIVEEARNRGMTIIGSSVGRRDSDGSLRPLNPEELAAAESLLGAKIVNVALEAGFDLEQAADGLTPADRLKGVKPDDWDSFRLDGALLAESRQKGVERFTANMGRFARELDAMIPPGANVLFVHAMAGGVPRARVYMPLLNRVFKGQGDRFISSEAFWQSDLGVLCRDNFAEVTAETFRHLVKETEGVRQRVSGAGGRVAYAAYGYHGCEVLVDGDYIWQSYTPYLTGWAKILLEQHAAAACAEGITAAVFNSPEIQTNSSALFLGVELSLYPLLAALDREGGGPVAESIKEECRQLLRDDVSLETLLAEANAYLSSPLHAPFREYATWPHHNTREQMELMLNSSARLMEMSRNPKEIVCAALSRAVFTGVGWLMLDTMWSSSEPVYWVSHDVIAKRLLTR
ncbi:hypothetical protein [Geobacter sp. DSM 9736]|uniref:enoyl ACP reductase FabMG family protein n=1 Tax=Geobacter sp. DSM 9736 TaxID=1277350 RepID=UPI000B509725|nr:hypothetical protein [Geobacter sp. DSM 9736]SNB46712.1 hypothetical protein SAMN06269301_2182 [Geobacter sp. DSM 9736]